MEYAVVVGLVVVACLSGISYLGRTTTAEAGRKSQLGAPDTGEAAPPTSAPNATTPFPPALTNGRRSVTYTVTSVSGEGVIAPSTFPNVVVNQP